MSRKTRNSKRLLPDLSDDDVGEMDGPASASEGSQALSASQESGETNKNENWEEERP